MCDESVKTTEIAMRLLGRCLLAAPVAIFLGALAGDLDRTNAQFANPLAHPLQPEAERLFRFAMWFVLSLIAFYGFSWWHELSDAHTELRTARRKEMVFNFLPEVKLLKAETDEAIAACNEGQDFLEFAAVRLREIKTLCAAALDRGDQTMREKALTMIAGYVLFVDPKLDNAIQRSEQQERMREIDLLLAGSRKHQNRATERKVGT